MSQVWTSAMKFYYVASHRCPRTQKRGASCSASSVTRVVRSFVGKPRLLEKQVRDR